jgi:hypothetical protein
MSQTTMMIKVGDSRPVLWDVKARGLAVGGYQSSRKTLLPHRGRRRRQQDPLKHCHENLTPKSEIHLNFKMVGSPVWPQYFG